MLTRPVKVSLPVFPLDFTQDFKNKHPFYLLQIPKILTPKTKCLIVILYM